MHWSRSENSINAHYNQGYFVFKILAVEVSIEIDTGKVRTVRSEAISKFHKVKSFRAVRLAHRLVPSPLLPPSLPNNFFLKRFSVSSKIIFNADVGYLSVSIRVHD